MGNFFNYIDSRDIGWLKLYRNQEDPEIGMDWITSLISYNVRHVLPLREFQKFIRNSVNYHNGQSYRETVNWGIIDPSK